MYHAVHVNIYLECHLPHKYGCENVIGHGEEKPLLQKEKEEGEKKKLYYGKSRKRKAGILSVL